MAIPVGVSCRFCERTDCNQRAAPSFKFRFNVDEYTKKDNFFSPLVEHDRQPSERLQSGNGRSTSCLFVASPHAGGRTIAILGRQMPAANPTRPSQGADALREAHVRRAARRRRLSLLVDGVAHLGARVPRRACSPSSPRRCNGASRTVTASSAAPGRGDQLLTVGLGVGLVVFMGYFVVKELLLYLTDDGAAARGGGRAAGCTRRACAHAASLRAVARRRA